MAHTPVPAEADGNPQPTAEDLNTHVVNNWIASVPDIMTAKGDLPVGTGTDTAALLSIGATNGMLLHSDASQTTGLKWRHHEYGWAAYGYQTTDLADATETLCAATTTDRFDLDSSGSFLGFTAKCTGYYFVSVLCLFAAGGGWSENEIAYIRLYVDTTPDQIIAATVAQGTHAEIVTVTGVGLVYLTLDQVLKPYLYQETGAPFTPAIYLYEMSVFQVA